MTSRYGATGDETSSQQHHRRILSIDKTPKVSHQRHLGLQRSADAKHAADAAPLLPLRRGDNDDGGGDDTSSFGAGGSEAFRLRRARSGEPGGEGGSFQSFRSLTSFGSYASLRGSLQGSLRGVVDRSFSRLKGKPSSVRDAGGDASAINEILNLIKNLVGAGALGLPSGVAYFANDPSSALVPTSIILVVMGAAFAYYFWLVGRVCRLTGAASYREAWEATVGDAGASWVALFTTLMAGLGCLAYSMILADTTRSLLSATGISGITRTQSLIGITLVVLLPLCMVRRLAVLAPFSFVGSGGLAFTIVAMAIRYFDGSYQPGGKYFDDVPPSLQPSFGNVGARNAASPDVLLLVCMTFQAYFCHYNAPRYYIELKENTIERFGAVTVTSFGVSALIYVALTAFGFLTFGGHSDGFILNNYSDNDGLASLCRFAIAVALAFTYPLPFMGTRDGVLDLLVVPDEHRTSSNLNVLTVILLGVFTGLAMIFTDLGMVNAVGGASFGTAVVFVFPSLMFSRVLKRLGVDASPRKRHEAIFASGLMFIGVFLGVVGVWVAVTFDNASNA